MRGCARGCRFCQAGFTRRPLRIKEATQVKEEVLEQLEMTGYQEASLLSLSVTDYPHIQELLSELNATLEGEQVNISLPSLRTESVSAEILKEMQKVRKSTVTIAPEAGSQRLRNLIAKRMTEADIIKAARYAVESKSRSLKLYFMLGLPTETDEDVLAIPQLVQRVLQEAKASKGLKVHVSVSNFVPKPHTPFQWAPFCSTDELYRKQQLLKESKASRAFQYRFHNIESSLVEAVLARGGRSVGKAILKAYQLGARFDAWQENFKPELWQEAWPEAAADYQTILEGFAAEQQLPWHKIKIKTSLDHLWSEYQRALA